MPVNCWWLYTIWSELLLICSSGDLQFSLDLWCNLFLKWKLEVKWGNWENVFNTMIKLFSRWVLDLEWNIFEMIHLWILSDALWGRWGRKRAARQFEMKHACMLCCQQRYKCLRWSSTAVGLTGSNCASYEGWDKI